MENCPICGTPYGKRKRCYACWAKSRRKGEMRVCPACKEGFYAPRWALNEGAGIYCSMRCKGEFYKGRDVPWAKRDQKTFDARGYVRIWMPEHPKAANGRVHEHRVVMEKHIGRYLNADEIVHHIDNDKTNNDISNLKLWNQREHRGYHSRLMQAERKRRKEAGG